MFNFRSPIQRQGAAERRGSMGYGEPAIGKIRAFSLIEVLVSVALLAVIVLGLLAMFNQTQARFRWA